MAASFDVEKDVSYQDTNEYRISSPARRRQINRYKKEFNISDEHMYLLLMREELDAVPKSELDSAEMPSRILLVIGVLFFWGSMQTALMSQGSNKVFGIFLSLASFCAVVAVYFTGLLNPYKRARRELDKRFKDLPEVPDFEEWCLQNPDKEDVKAQKAYKRRRH